jgi:hypothetical protein
VNSKTKAGDIITLDFRAYYRAMVTQTAWYWQKNRYPETNGTEHRSQN